MKGKKSIVVLSICLVLVLALVTLTIGCAPTTPTSSKPIVIGNLGIFTGNSADANPWMLRAAELACNEYQWKIAGREIKLVSEDSAGDPTIAADKAKKLLEVDKADVFIGPLTANAAFPVAALLQPTGIPHASVMEFPPELLAIGNNEFSHGGTQRSTGFWVGVYAYEKLGYRTATVIHDDIIFAEEFLQGAMDGFVSKGGQIVQRQRTPMDTMDYGPYLTAMKQADFCMMWFIGFHVFQFINQYDKYGFKMPLVQAGVVSLSQQMITDLGDKAKGLIGISYCDANIKGSDVKSWVDRWEKLNANKTDKEGKYPSYTEGCAMYSATTILLQAIESTKGDTTPAVLREALMKIKAKTPWGTVSFSEGRVGIGNMYIMQVIKDGNNYTTTDIFKYENITRDEPANAKDIAPKM